MITRAGAADAGHCGLLVATAFQHLPQAAWLIGDAERRLPVMAANFTMLVEHALAHGHVDLVDDRAVAVWFHREAGVEIPEPPDYDARVDADCGEYADRFRALDKAFEAHHPTRPHHHLALLAVHPKAQRAGLGGELLRHHHSTLDSGGLDAFLEASTPESARLYHRHGYQPHGSPYALPDDGPLMWPLWRSAGAE
ncbi:GNAT family N-acetyltransferase [Actinokineospora sp. NBRC 105648]|uniref:GNAT family N-acetyltransferase n=1 Tax=Actinokineospora sp. NBRC 105648 TaxID=3032206 RepID=UPI0024A48261|nr:GNAT family N-acetyltransferase [Actinokineospora sp. NBRC 105648]GLZ40432.1 N-acetyltransferase [Actinokineospora sp. NBRC 105648]